MPVVPFSNSSSTKPKVPLRALPPESWAMMAAAQMHAEGRLLPNEPSGKSPLLEAAPK